MIWSLLGCLRCSIASWVSYTSLGNFCNVVTASLTWGTCWTTLPAPTIYFAVLCAPLGHQLQQIKGMWGQLPFSIPSLLAFAGPDGILLTSAADGDNATWIELNLKAISLQEIFQLVQGRLFSSIIVIQRNQKMFPRSSNYLLSSIGVHEYLTTSARL